MSTGSIPRNCRTCGETFTGLGILCPIHLGAHARTRGAQLVAERRASNQIIAGRETAHRRPRAEFPDELDLM